VVSFTKDRRRYVVKVLEMGISLNRGTLGDDRMESGLAGNLRER
jgi:hypothetical protein